MAAEERKITLQVEVDELRATVADKEDETGALAHELEVVERKVR
jgi:hypothetical protein